MVHGVLDQTSFAGRSPSVLVGMNTPPLRIVRRRSRSENGATLRELASERRSNYVGGPSTLGAD
jgi:hypothetical protein